VDPQNDQSQYAYNANTGWVNAEPGGNDGPGARLLINSLSGWLWSANTGWISLNCGNTDSCDNVGYGVSHDGAGNLGGYAWSANTGWVSFSCVNTVSCGTVEFGVRFDTGNTGETVFKNGFEGGGMH